MSGAIQVLPDHLLLNIMRMLPFHTRREVVPLVCKRWSQVVRSCSYLWPALLVDFVYECFGVDVMSENVEPKHVRNMSSRNLLRWLRMRELDVQALRIFGSSVEGVTHDFLDDSVSQLLETVTCSVQELSLEAAQDIIALPAFFNTLPKLSCMRSLELKNIATPILDAQAVALARLTGLQELILEVDADVEPSAATERFPGLQSFPRELCELSQLRTLSLGGHRISGLPDEFTVLTNLQQLLIDHCPMTNVCPKIGSLTGLTTLVLEGTLDFLQNPYRNELGNLTGLRCLNLNSAGLPAIPSFITKLTNLELLEFDRNDMSSRDAGPNFPPEMTELTQLTRITMAQCRLSEFGRVLCSMPSLRVIDMTDNELLDAAMPPEILQLTNLTALGLSCNLLRRIPPVLMQLTSLRELYLEDNPAFQVVDPLDAFLDFPHLQVVAVGKNDLHAHGAWTSQSLAHVADFCRRLGQRSQPELRLTM